MNNTASEALTKAIAIVEPLDDADRHRVLTAMLTFYGIALDHTPLSTPQGPASRKPPNTPRDSTAPFSEGHDINPKQFLKDKRPATAVERVACLAYFLHHHYDQPYFKTSDISKLNTEAAQPKFGNASQAVANALSLGYLAAGPKNHRQLSAFGEEFVTALPDRDAAKEVSNLMRPVRKRRSRKPSDNTTTSSSTRAEPS